MNIINENEVRLANLKAVAAMRYAEVEALYRDVSLAATKIIEDAVAASGVSGYALQKCDNGLLRDLEYMTLDGEIDGERLHGIDIYFRRDWSGKEDSPRFFAMNTSCFGTVKAGDKRGVAYCVLVGYLATHLQEIQDALNAIPEWEAYDRSCRIHRISVNELEAFERKLKDEAKAARLAEVEKRLVAGAEVAFSYDEIYDLDRHISVAKGVRTRKVEKVTNKLVFFENEYKQYKKADVLEDLVRGLDNRGWSFASDVDMTQFPRPVKH